MRSNIKTLSSSLLIVSAALIAGSVQSGYSDANPPNLMSYQGYLEDASGAAIATTPENYDVIFRIYVNEQETDGETILWSEKQTVTFDKGIFSVLLGAGVAYSSSEPYPDLSEVFGNLSTTDYDGTTVSERYIGITVIDLPDGDNSELAPRLRLLSSPYSFLATKALVADRLSNSEFTVDDTSGDVAIGKNLSVTGTSSFTGSMTLSSSFSAGADSTVTGQLQATTLKSTGATTVDGALTANSVVSTTSITAGSTLKANGKASFYGTSTVASESLNGAVLIGSETGENIGIDGNEIQARSGTAASTLNFNARGGTIQIGISGNNTAIRGTSSFAEQADFNGAVNFVKKPTLPAGLVFEASTANVPGASIENVQVRIREAIMIRGSGYRWVIGEEIEDLNDPDLHILFNDSDSDTGYKTATFLEPSGSWQIPSDRRVKKNIETIKKGTLEKIMALRPVKFHRNFQEDSEHKNIGFIAQEVEESFPDVTQINGGFYSINYDDFSVLAIAGLQELKIEQEGQIQKLEKENLTLRNQNNYLIEQFMELKSRMDVLESKTP